MRGEEQLYETMLAKFGSRIVFIPVPRKRCIRQGLMGFYYDKPVQTTLAVHYEGVVRALPFSRKYELSPLPERNQIFESIRQEIGLTYVKYYCHSEEIPFETTWTIIAPFYPKDIELSVAPFFYILVEVQNLTEKKIKGSALLAMENVLGRGEGNEDLRRKAKSSLYQETDLVGFVFEDSDVSGERVGVVTRKQNISYAIGDLSQKLYLDFASRGRLANTIDDRFLYSTSSGLSWEFELKVGEKRERIFIYAGYHSHSTLRVHQEKSYFLYTKYFKNLKEVIRYAWEGKGEIRRKICFFEEIVTQSSLPESTRKLISFSFQSYVANTWWVRTEGGKEYFTVWEGSCRFHSTLDVAYNIELFSLFFWPELLKKQLEEWSCYFLNGWLSHDIGDDLYICGQTYDHDMPVEENLNYLLLLYAYWKFTADDEFVSQKYRLIKKLIFYLHSQDKDGDGIPDTPRAVLNTFDDASYGIQGSQGQSYLGVKCLAGYLAGRAFSRHQKDKKFEEECEERIKTLTTTLLQKNWLGDHFAICLDRKVSYSNEYSMHTANGLLYLLLTDTKFPLSLELFRQDMEVHLNKLMGRYGCTHSTADYTLWVSQNIWRDIVGLYLGVETLENSLKYWEFERDQNIWKGGAFTDIYRYGFHLMDLYRYPRGLASFGYLYAVGGVSVDVVEGKLKIASPLTSFKIPLTLGADGERLRVPWLILKNSPQETEFQITRLDKLTQFKKICLKLPTRERPEGVQFLSGKYYSLSEIKGKKVEVEGVGYVQIKETFWEEKRKIWFMEAEFSLEEGKYWPGKLEVRLIFKRRRKYEG